MRAISITGPPVQVGLVDVRSFTSIRAILDVLYFSLVYFFASGIFARVLGNDAQSGAGGGDSAISQVVSGSLYVLSVVLAYRYFPEMWTLFIRSRWMCVFFVFTYLAIFWSADISAGLRDLRYLLVLLVAALYFAVRLSARQVVQILVWCSLLAAVLSCAGQFVLPPSLDPAPGWTGIFVTKNFLGLAMVIGIASTFADRGRWTVLRAATLTLCSALLVLSQSTTSYLCVLLTIFVVIYVNVGRWAKLILLSAAAIAIFLVVATPEITTKIFEVSGKDSNLSGRNVIWEFAYQGFLQKPFFGYGASGFWLTVGDLAIWTLGWNPNHAHNGYIEVALHGGLVGLVLLVLTMGGSFVLAHRLQSGFHQDTSRLLSFLTGTLLVHNLAETDFMAITGIWFCFLVAYFLALRALKESFSSGQTIAPRKAG